MFYHIYSLIFIYSRKGDTDLWDTRPPIPNDKFRLNLNSPAIDAGNPSPEYNDFDGTQNDMRAYGGYKGNW